jgi:DNA-binding MarR family transcriptional regulator
MPGDEALLTTATQGPGHLARRFFQVHARLWQDLVGAELTGPQFSVLAVLQLRGPLDQGTLGELARLDKSTAGPLLERLERRGLVAITRDEADRRRKLLTLTDDGAALVELVAPRAVEVGDRMLAPLNEAEREQLLALLARVA